MKQVMTMQELTYIYWNVCSKWNNRPCTLANTFTVSTAFDALNLILHSAKSPARLKELAQSLMHDIVRNNADVGKDEKVLANGTL